MKKTIVIKVGTSTLTHDTGKPNFSRINALAQVLSDINNSGINVCLVSSGAISVGRSKLNLINKTDSIAEKQACAAIGQCELMHIYDRAFSDYATSIAQVLLTKDITDSPEGKSNVINTVNKLFEYNVVPIVNENDSVSVEELIYGDNDTLSAIVAVLIKADMLIILSDINGLYDKDPKCLDSKLIKHVNKIDENIMALAKGAGTNRGTGGMITKLNAAQIVMENDIDMVIANGKDPKILYDVLLGKGEYTLFKKEK